MSQASRPDIRVPMRQISQSDTSTTRVPEKNPPIYVYDCSGPYTDPTGENRHPQGPCSALRQKWIEERNDTDVLKGLSSEYGRQREADPALAEMRFDLKRQPRRALPGRNVTQIHYARQGIITPEMEFVAIRENPAAARVHRKACAIPA
jgi:phosphomethylpyrimidine synthase